MTETDIQAMRDHLAVEVMGFSLKDKSRGPGFANIYIDQRNHNFWLNAADWRPDTDMNQLFMCLDAFEWWGASRNMLDDGYLVGIYPNFESNHEISFEVEHEDLALACMIAMCRATGYEE